MLEAVLSVFSCIIRKLFVLIYTELRKPFKIIAGLRVFSIAGYFPVLALCDTIISVWSSRGWSRSHGQYLLTRYNQSCWSLLHITPGNITHTSYWEWWAREDKRSLQFYQNLKYFEVILVILSLTQVHWHSNVGINNLLHIKNICRMLPF